MTFSLVGRCDRTGAVGAVIASASMAVAARCAAVRAGAGAVCSQSTTDPRLRDALLEAMAGGLTAGDALAALTARTGDIAYRQLAVVDAAGGSACYSGELALGDAADVCAPGAAAAGNLLADRGVPAAMLATFQDTDLRVDWHDDPIGQLAGLWQIWQPQAESYVQRALRPAEM
jgi:uncharacterized Ntn-hydrolase superfamily protein